MAMIKEEEGVPTVGELFMRQAEFSQAIDSCTVCEIPLKKGRLRNLCEDCPIQFSEGKLTLTLLCETHAEKHNEYHTL